MWQAFVGEGKGNSGRERNARGALLVRPKSSFPSLRTPATQASLSKQVWRNFFKIVKVITFILNLYASR